MNPANPAQSILFRDVRWEMLAFKGMFGLVFGSAGLAMMIAGDSALSAFEREK